MKNLIVKLARRSWQMSQAAQSEGRRNVSAFMAPLAVLALEGDDGARQRFIDTLRQMAAEGWGLDGPALKNRLGGSFCLSSVVEAYRDLIGAGLIDDDTQRCVAPWLHDFAMAAPDGRVARTPGFEQWHLRNQNVPARAVYDIAALLDATAPGRFDTAPLWAWADAQIVGWDLTWRDPDDSWLYQFIWIWSAYRHAALRRPDLLHSENARRSFDFYQQICPPGRGLDVVFGDSKPGDLLGPAVAFVLGARLFDDGQLLWTAERLLEETDRRGDVPNLTDRGPEFCRLYDLWPQHLTAAEPHRRSLLIASPLAGRGWTLDSTPYNDSVKRSDPRFPFHGQNTNSWDALYQVQDPAAYAVAKPDKLVFCDGNRPEAMFALADLRSHGLHDHPDALGLVTLLCDGQPWLVESSYLPREFNRQRWLHNVPLARPARLGPQDLRCWRADVWREVECGDVTFDDRDGRIVAAARLRHDGFDYVDFDGGGFDYERTFVYLPDAMLVVLDRIVAAVNTPATIGQIWHTPAAAELRDNTIALSQSGRRLAIRCAQSAPCQWALTQHDATQHDPFYFRPGNPIRDLLCWASLDLSAGQTVAMAACFAREPVDVTLEQQGPATRLTCGAIALAVERFGQVEIVTD